MDVHARIQSKENAVTLSRNADNRTALVPVMERERLFETTKIRQVHGALSLLVARIFSPALRYFLLFF